MKKFTTSPEDKGKRLDKYLTENLPETTRSQIKKMIRRKLVLVNGKPPSVHQFLNKNDEIEVLDLPAQKKIAIPKIKILKKGQGYLVIDKPSGLLSHHTNSGKSQIALTDWLVKKFPKTKDVGDPDRPGIVHRLDRETSGAMVVATTQEMYDHLKKLFHDRKIKKKYTALVHGSLPALEGHIDKPIGRSKTFGRMVARPQFLKSKDRDAITDYKIQKRFQKYDLVTAEPLTGRTHQIRVHFKSIGHPIVADRLYKLRGQKNLTDLKRFFLHASEISFEDLNNNTQTITSPLPPDLVSFLETLK